MLHDMAVVYCLSISVCQLGLSSDVFHDFIPMSTGRSDSS